MVDKRNCLIELVQYIESLGVQVNIGKNKARGNKGFFCNRGAINRIDISKNIDSKSAYGTLLHEFAHFLHHRYDKTLKSLDFVFENLSEEEHEELLNITVKNVPKEFARSLFDLKQRYSEENKILSEKIKRIYPDFKLSARYSKLERGLMFSFSLSDVQKSYLKLKSNQKSIVRINSKINKLNKYYNQPTELWARFFEFYFMYPNKAKVLAPNLSERIEKVIVSKRIPEIVHLYDLLSECEEF